MCDRLEPRRMAIPPIRAVLVLDKGGHEDTTPDASTHQNDKDESETTMLIDVEDPNAPSWREAITSSEKEKWLEGTCKELHSLEDMEVFHLVPHLDVPSNQKVLCGKFMCRLKCNESGNPICHKVWWVVKGFQQVWG